ncbi:MAG: molecular chaperone HtpG [Myxococcales bacterium]|nr:molecular chaperone HtpG [Myxococcales bacterium]MCB9532259.1 molecular chaperone HtpG [Myxococcales bacterium]MCB9533923.1 molecular chaperone HtpG [Myxococcales bacterium]
MSNDAPNVHAFQAEVAQVLDLVIHSLYRNKEIFLRELISNASDALDKLRFAAVTEPALAEGHALEIRLIPDAEAKTLTLWDSGIGMSRDELVKNLGTIAHSGTKAFLAANAGGSGDLNLIGQFGVGFYSAFLVANRVEVVSRRAGSDEAWRWESEARDSFSVTPAERDVRGTTITLHLTDEHADFASDWRIRSLVERYSDYVEHPIKLVSAPEDDEAGEPSIETLNREGALWMRSPSDIDDDAYEEFYKHLTHDWEASLARTHFKIEGNQLFRSLLFIPKRPPFDLFDREAKHGVRLYVRRVFIMDDCDDLLPTWLRFVRGVVDSDDLPLNVSRDVLQDSNAARIIKKQLVKKVLDLLEDIAKNRPEDYIGLWNNFGRVLKEGLYFEPEHRDRLSKLLRFASSHHPTEQTSLQQYVERMKDGQPAIYYALGASRATVEGGPHTEALRSRGYEVLFLTDPIDQWAISNLEKFDDKPLVSVASADLDLDAAASDDDREKAREADAKRAEELTSLTDRFAAVLGDRVSEVKLSRRLSDSPVCLVIPEGGLPSHIERLLRANNQDVPKTPRILEINPDHAVIRGLERIDRGGKSGEDVAELVNLLYDQALLAEGSPIDDPARFARGMTRLMSTAVSSGRAKKSSAKPTDAAASEAREPEVVE